MFRILLHCQAISAAAVAAKSLQSCPTLCDPIDGSPPGSSVPGILQARILEWVAISFSNACIHAKSLQSCPTLCDPMDSVAPDSSVLRILQERILEWVAITYKQFLCLLWSPTFFLGDGQMYLVNFISSLSSVGNYIGMPQVPCIMDIFLPHFYDCHNYEFDILKL